MESDNNQLELFLTLEGYEGPIDLLLKLAKDQKVDLSCISIVELTNQYISFIQKVTDLEIAADYLIMASWLVYLKSKLLLPKSDEDLEHENLKNISEDLKESLMKLEAMQKAGKKLFKLPKLGSERFSRGLNETIKDKVFFDYKVKLYDLLKAYANVKNSSSSNNLTIQFSKLLSVEGAMDNFRNLYFKLDKWMSFSDILFFKNNNKNLTKNDVASHFAASLELVKKGEINIFQNLQFDTLWIKHNKINKNV